MRKLLLWGLRLLVRHKPGCTAVEGGQRLEISDLERILGILLSMKQKQRHFCAFKKISKLSIKIKHV